MTQKPLESTHIHNGDENREDHKRHTDRHQEQHHRLQNRGQSVELGVDLPLKGVCDPHQHRLQLTRAFADGDHMGDGGWKMPALAQSDGQ